MNRTFKNCTAEGTLSLLNADLRNVTEMNETFYNASNLIINTELYLDDITSLKRTFENPYNVNKIDFTLSDTSNLTNMYRTFIDCYSLTYVNMSSFNTSNVTDWSGIFDYCYNLKTLNLGEYFFASKINNIYLASLKNWTDSSVRTSLFENSYDRITYGLSTKSNPFQLKISQNTYNVLSDDDKEIISSKGYKIMIIKE